MNDLKRSPAAVQNIEKCRGQGMVEYLLILAVVVSITVASMTTVSESMSDMINVMITNIESVTGVPSSSSEN